MMIRCIECGHEIDGPRRQDVRADANRAAYLCSACEGWTTRERSRKFGEHVLVTIENGNIALRLSSEQSGSGYCTLTASSTSAHGSVTSRDAYEIGKAAQAFIEMMDRVLTEPVQR